MSQTATCPRCQTPLAADAPEGLCPACLMAAGLASAPSPAPGSAATTPWTDAKRAAAIADLAPHFPQLEIIELLGQGGMGAVYKARQSRGPIEGWEGAAYERQLLRNPRLTAAAQLKEHAKREGRIIAHEIRG